MSVCRLPFQGRTALEKVMATHSSFLAWKILQTEKPGRLQSMGSQESDMTQRLNHHHRNNQIFSHENGYKISQEHSRFILELAESSRRDVTREKIELRFPNVFGHIEGNFTVLTESRKNWYQVKSKSKQIKYEATFKARGKKCHTERNCSHSVLCVSALSCIQTL